MAITLALLALLIEAVFGYPDWLLRTIGHPVTWMGRLIGFSDQALNRDAMSSAARRAAGTAAIVLIISVAAAIAYAVDRLFIPWPLGTFALAVAASTLIAQRSLH